MSMLIYQRCPIHKGACSIASSRRGVGVSDRPEMWTSTPSDYRRNGSWTRLSRSELISGTSRSGVVHLDTNRVVRCLTAHCRSQQKSALPDLNSPRQSGRAALCAVPGCLGEFKSERADFCCNDSEQSNISRPDLCRDERHLTATCPR